MVNSIALIFVFSCLTFVIGLDCTSKYSMMPMAYISFTTYTMVTIIISVIEHCCYYYSIVPKNVTTVSRNPQGMSINWLCQIYSPHSDYTNLSVQWYKAATSDMAEGELLSELSGKYSFTISQLLPVVNDSQSALHGLFLDEFALTIHNFNSSSDDGYYWCQIVANGSCPLEPSPTGYVALDQYTVEKYEYNLQDFIEYLVPPVCAEGTLCTGETPTTAEPSLQITLANEEGVGDHTKFITVSQSMTVIILYGVIGGLLCIIIFLLLIIIACSVCYVRNRKLNTAIRGRQNSNFYVICTKISSLVPRPHLS